MTAFAHQVRQDPVILSELQVLNPDRLDFSPAQTTPYEHGEYGSVPHVPELQSSGCGDEGLALLGRKPVPDPDAQPLCTFHSAYTCGEIRAQEATVGGFVRQSADSGQPEVDCRRGVPPLFQRDSVPGHDCSIECQSGSEQYQSMKFRMAWS